MKKPMRAMALRLALRHEGEWWNAYLALPHTMEGAKLIGAVLIDPAARDPAIKEAFLSLMKMMMAHGMEVVTGERPESFDVQPAPESERAGHG